MGLVASSALSVGAVWQLGNSAELLRCSYSLAEWHCLTGTEGGTAGLSRNAGSSRQGGPRGVNSFALASLGLGCPSFGAWGKHAARAAPGFFLFYFGIAEPPKCDLPGIAEGPGFARCVGRRRRVLHMLGPEYPTWLKSVLCAVYFGEDCECAQRSSSGVKSALMTAERGQMAFGAAC